MRLGVCSKHNKFCKDETQHGGKYWHEEDGWKFKCLCGWTSPLCEYVYEARQAFDIHCIKFRLRENVEGE